MEQGGAVYDAVAGGRDSRHADVMVADGGVKASGALCGWREV